jgi:hypothetical protein
MKKIILLIIIFITLISLKAANECRIDSVSYYSITTNSQNNKKLYATDYYYYNMKNLIIRSNQIYYNYYNKNYIYEYNSQDSITLKIEQVWNAKINDWENENKNEYKYDINGIKIENSSFKWNIDSKLWESNIKYEYKYELNGKIIENSIYKWNLISKLWEIRDKNNFFYDSIGNKIKIINQTLNYSTNQFNILIKT